MWKLEVGLLRPHQGGSDNADDGLSQKGANPDGVEAGQPPQLERAVAGGPDGQARAGGHDDG